MKLYEIARIIEAEFLTLEAFKDKDITKAGASDLMSDVLAAEAEGAILLTGITTPQVARTATIAGIGAVALIRGKKPPAEVIALSMEQELPLLTTPLSMFIASGRLYQNGLRGLNGDR